MISPQAVFPGKFVIEDLYRGERLKILNNMLEPDSEDITRYTT
jgi:hypothetical protein